MNDCASCTVQDRTTIIVAHRLSTIVNADAVAGAGQYAVAIMHVTLHLSSLPTVRMGAVMSHAELSHAGGAFESLMKLQMGSHADAAASTARGQSAEAAISTDSNLLARNVHGARASSGSSPAAKVTPVV